MALSDRPSLLLAANAGAWLWVRHDLRREAESTVEVQALFPSGDADRAEVTLADGSAWEASLVDGVEVVPANTLGEVIRLLRRNDPDAVAT